MPFRSAPLYRPRCAERRRGKDGVQGGTHAPPLGGGHHYQLLSRPKQASAILGGTRKAKGVNCVLTSLCGCLVDAPRAAASVSRSRARSPRCIASRPGLSRREIGTQLYISLNPVRTHTRELYRKLGAASRNRGGRPRGSAPPARPRSITRVIFGPRRSNHGRRRACSEWMLLTATASSSKASFGARCGCAFDEMTISAHDGIMEITGQIVDPSHLHRLLERIAGLGLTKHSVTSLETDNGGAAIWTAAATKIPVTMTERREPACPTVVTSRSLTAMTGSQLLISGSGQLQDGRAGCVRARRVFRSGFLSRVRRANG